MSTRIRAVLASITLAFAAVLLTPASGAATAESDASPAQSCQLSVGNSVGYSALMLYVGVGLEGCDNPVTEAWVELQRSDSPDGPFVTVDTSGVYSGGAAWFDEPNYGCAYYIGVAHWQNQTATTPNVARHCL